MESLLGTYYHLRSSWVVKCDLKVSKGLTSVGWLSEGVMNQLDPIEELYDMYSEEEDTLRIVELGDDGLNLVLDTEGLADPYMDL